MNPILDRLNERIDFVKHKLSDYEVTESGCFKYKGSLNHNGYGRFEVTSFNKRPRQRKVFAHRAAYAIHYQIDPLDNLVCHSCDNPSCINPSHLWLGSFAENMKDMSVKGRSAPQDGANNHNSKLNENDVYQIKRLIDQGYNNKQIAGVKPVTHSMISCIRLGKSWKNVA